MTECIEWAKYRNKGGYGVAWDPVSKRGVLAHRLAVNATEGSTVRHTCDNRGCVNPDHLIVGTQQENIADMVEKGRQRGAKGVRNVKAKLTEELAKWARESPQTLKDTAFALDVSFALISQIRNGRIWNAAS